MFFTEGNRILKYCVVVLNYLFGVSKHKLKKNSIGFNICWHFNVVDASGYWVPRDAIAGEKSFYATRLSDSTGSWYGSFRGLHGSLDPPSLEQFLIKLSLSLSLTHSMGTPGP